MGPSEATLISSNDLNFFFSLWHNSPQLQDPHIYLPTWYSDRGCLQSTWRCWAPSPFSAFPRSHSRCICGCVLSPHTYLHLRHSFHCNDPSAPKSPWAFSPSLDFCLPGSVECYLGTILLSWEHRFIPSVRVLPSGPFPVGEGLVRGILPGGGPFFQPRGGSWVVIYHPSPECWGNCGLVGSRR